MKLIMLCALFAPIIYLALRQKKKWYLYLFFAFIAVLPEQFSVRLHDSLPLISATRILILLVMGFWLYDKWKTKNFHFPKSLLLFLAVNLIVSFVNLRYGFGELNRIFLFIFERVLVVIMIADMIRDREEFNRCIDFAIMGCTALAVIGIIQTVFNYDISSVLHLTKTITSIQLNKRMGLVRAFGTYNAISFGCYCSFMALLILYRLYNTKSIWHSLAFAFNFVALICTFTRSAWLCLAGIVFLILLVYRMELLRRLWSGLVMILALLVLLCCFQPKLFSAFVETGKSSINTVLGVLPEEVVSLFVPDQNNMHPSHNNSEPSSTEDSTIPDETEPVSPDANRPGFTLDKDFGMNANDPTYSRTAQWTAVQYMAQEGDLLFGYGYNALPRGMIHFFFDRWAAKWQPTTFLDVGFVALIAEGGLVGALSYLGLLGYLFVYAFRKKSPFKERKMDFYWLAFFMIPLYLLLNYLASFLFAHIVWIFIGLFFTHKKLCETVPVVAELQKSAVPENVLPAPDADTP